MRVHTHMLIMWLFSMPINTYSSCLLYDHILLCVVVSQLFLRQSGSASLLPFSQLECSFQHSLNCKQERLICHSALFHLLSPSLSLCLLDRRCDTMTECHLMRFLFQVEHAAEGLLWCVKYFCRTHSLPSSLLLSLSLPLCNKDTPL